MTRTIRVCFFEQARTPHIVIALPEKTGLYSPNIFFAHVQKIKIINENSGPAAERSAGARRVVVRTKEARKIRRGRIVTIRGIQDLVPEMAIAQVVLVAAAEVRIGQSMSL